MVEHDPIAGAATRKRAADQLAELSFAAICLGILFAVLYGAGTAYVGLRAGMTISASIPIAVLSVSILRTWRASTIQENNIIQTIGSVSEAIAAGLVFTTPALIFLQEQRLFEPITLLALAVVAGSAGVAFAALLVKPHLALSADESNHPTDAGSFRFPEAVACANILRSAAEHARTARVLYAGLGVGVAVRVGSQVFGLLKESVLISFGETSVLKFAVIGFDLSPEYLGVGYFIGGASAAVLLAGGLFSSCLLVPLLGQFISPSQLQITLKQLGYSVVFSKDNPVSSSWLFLAHVRYLAIGVILMAGIMRVVDSIPVIVGTVRRRLKEKDRSIEKQPNGGRATVLLLGIFIVCIFFIPSFAALPLGWRVLVSVIITILAMFFASVSVGVVSLIGGSSNPVSAMTLSSLAIVSLCIVGARASIPSAPGFVLLGGALVCICAANCGASAQAFVVGKHVGGTPQKQFIALMIGTFVSSCICALVVVGLQQSSAGPLGNPNFPAPQAQMMAAFIKALFSGNLDYGSISIGAVLAVIVRICSINPLLFGVGMYLPITTTGAIAVGGGIRTLSRVVDSMRSNRRPQEPAAQQNRPRSVDSGEFYATGLIAGGAVVGMCFALLSIPFPSVLSLRREPALSSFGGNEIIANLCAVVISALMAFSLYRISRRVQ